MALDFNYRQIPCMSLIKKLAGETALYGLGNILNRVLNYLIVTPYLTYVFNDDQGEYGIHGIMYAFAALLMVILTYGLETAFFRFASDKTYDLSKVLSTAVLSIFSTTLIFVGLIVYFATPLAGFLTRPEDWSYVVLFACIVGLDVLAAIPFAHLRHQNRPVRFVAIKAVNVVANGVFIVLLLEIFPWAVQKGWLDMPVFLDKSQRLYFVFIANLAASALTFGMLSPALLRIQPVFDVALWKKMMHYALPLVVVGIAGMINQLADRYLISRWMPGTPEENLVSSGIYSAAARIAVLLNLFTQAFRYAAEPFFFRHAAEDDSREIYGQVGKIFTIVGGFTFLGILFYLDLIQYLIGSNFREGLRIVPILLMAYLLLGLYFNFSIWYKLADFTLAGAIIALGGVVITLLMNAFLIPQMGYEGAAWSALACFGFMAIAGYLSGQWFYPIAYPIAPMLAYIGLSLGLYGISLWLRQKMNAELVPVLIINTLLLLLYLAIVFFAERKPKFKQKSS